MISSPKDVLSFWFPAGYDRDDNTFMGQVRWWFAGGPDVDQTIVRRFRDTLEVARRGELVFWKHDPHERLALIIVLDQFSRNFYRGTPDAYAQDHIAQGLVLGGLDVAMEKALSLAELIFFILPLLHSEEVALHNKAIPYVEEVVRKAPSRLRESAEFFAERARAHRETIIRFGRHPQRNAILGRPSTPEELQHIAQLPADLRIQPIGRLRKIRAVSSQSGS